MLATSQCVRHCRGMHTRFDDIVDLWPNIQAFADDLGVPYVTAQSMKFRNNIHSRHWRAVIAAAQRHGFEGISYEVLVSIKPGNVRSRSVRNSTGAAA